MPYISIQPDLKSMVLSGGGSSLPVLNKKLIKLYKSVNAIKACHGDCECEHQHYPTIGPPF